MAERKQFTGRKFGSLGNSESAAAKRAEQEIPRLQAKLMEIMSGKGGKKPNAVTNDLPSWHDLMRGVVIRLGGADAVMEFYAECIREAIKKNPTGQIAQRYLQHLLDAIQRHDEKSAAQDWRALSPDQLMREVQSTIVSVVVSAEEEEERLTGPQDESLETVAEDKQDEQPTVE